MSAVIKNTAYYTIGNFTTKAISFLLLPIYTSYLSPTEYGIVSSMQVLTNILLIFFTIGLEKSIYRLYFDYKSDKNRKDFLGTISISIAAISLLTLSVLFILNSQVEKIYKSIDFYPYYSYAILTAFLSSFEVVPIITIQVKGQAKRYLVLSLLSLTFRVIPVLWQVVFLKAGAAGMLKGAAIGSAASLVYIIPITIKQINFCLNFQILKNTLHYCLPLIPIVISSWVVNMSDRIFIERFFSSYEVGIYSFGYKIGMIVQLLASSIQMAYSPFFYRLANSSDQIFAKNKLYHTNNNTITFLLFINFIIAFLSKDIVYLFFDNKYHESYKVIPIIILGYFFIQLTSVLSLAFYQAKKTFSIMAINITAAFINIFLNYILISKYSYYGAALSTVTTQFIFFLILYFNAKRYYFIPYNWMLIVPLFILLSIFTLLVHFYITVSTFHFILKICLVAGFIAVFLTRNKIFLNDLRGNK